MKIGIIDIGIGNLGSLKNAVYSLGFDFNMIKHPKELQLVSHIILPGVGSFSEGKRRLDESGLSAEIVNQFEKKKPILGICLGMQLLATQGFEGEKTFGLNIIPGTVYKLPTKDNYRIPHVGWNNVANQRKHKIFYTVKDNVDFYFVHSYHFNPEIKEHLYSTTFHGIDFASCVAFRTAIGLQFHPEKSQKNGLKLIENFCMWDGHA